MELHKKINLWSAITSFGVELAMFWVLHHMSIPTATVPVYIFKYIVFPGVLNFTAVGVLYAIFHFSKSRTVKKYTASITLVIICFVLLIVHSIFPAVHMLFGIPIILTTVYGSYRLTNVTGILSFAAELIGELFIVWDKDKISIFTSSERIVNFGITLVILIFIYAISLVILHYERLKNDAVIIKDVERYQLKTQLLKDELTSLYNRTALQEYFNTMNGSPGQFILAIIDVDDFKEINDTLGHVRGDVFLKEFAIILRRCSRPHTAFRFAGDEFCILFKDESIENVVNICRTIQKELKVIRHFDDFRKITASFGIARYEQHLTPLELLEQADQALYQSKKNKGSITIYKKR
ncbi:MAG: GGDEF domain-containing protein [Muricomes sp.]